MKLTGYVVSLLTYIDTLAHVIGLVQQLVLSVCVYVCLSAYSYCWHDAFWITHSALNRTSRSCEGQGQGHWLYIRNTDHTAYKKKFYIQKMYISQAAQSRQPCVNSHQLSQWEALETVMFDPAQNRHTLTDH